AALLGLFGALALILASIGIYGVLAYSVAQRTSEIGLRMALGAQPRQVLGLVLKQGMLLAIIGAGVGIIVALPVARMAGNLLYGVSATDPLTYVGITLLLMAVALLACYLPARRATRIAPRWRSHFAAAGAARNAFALARDFFYRGVCHFAAFPDHLDFRGPARRGGSRLRRSRRRCKFAIARHDFSPSHQGDYRATPF